MKTIKKHTRKISLLFATALLFVSCSQYDYNEQLPENKDNVTQMLQRGKSFSGEELFKSVFFGIGEFANEIRQLEKQVELTNELDSEKREEVLTNLGVFTNKVNNENPTFFKDFKDLITSGNHLKIKNSIELGSDMIENNIEIIFPEFKKLFKKVKSDIDTSELVFNEQGR
ncbi:hypothetical protein [Flavobacterium sp. CS20]|uniref:hypothetical protein n=1 Tax=Flavobacterium sp. CS20 TaxID=2775246 RepID=UPI001B3A478D|nr:hypothetical protein [Flavobacterium sp. CS20]QTY27749.1 hypothetical protein IGB25_04270 [Flavobacterium sp. CS20]